MERKLFRIQTLFPVFLEMVTLNVLKILSTLYSQLRDFCIYHFSLEILFLVSKKIPM